MLLLMIFQVILHITLILLFHCPSCRGERSFTVWWPLVGRTSCGVLWCISCSRTSHHRVMKHLQHGSADVERSASPKEIQRLLPFLCRASVFWCQYIYCQCGHKVFVSVHSVHFCSVHLSLTLFVFVTLTFRWFSSHQSEKHCPPHCTQHDEWFIYNLRIEETTSLLWTWGLLSLGDGIKKYRTERVVHEWVC